VTAICDICRVWLSGIRLYTRHG